MALILIEGFPQRLFSPKCSPQPTMKKASTSFSNSQATCFLEIYYKMLHCFYFHFKASTLCFNGCSVSTMASDQVNLVGAVVLEER